MMLVKCLVAFFGFANIQTAPIVGQKIYERTMTSPAIPLYPGQIANTDGSTFSLDWINEPIAVTYFDSQVIDEDGNAVALYDLYIHHWLIYINAGKNSAGPCLFSNVWGIGAEMRGTIYEYPSPYAVIFDGTENITANLHFLRTDEIADNVHQLCIECHCNSGTPDNPEGGIPCCDDGTYCWGTGLPRNSSVVPKNYYLQYTIRYTNVTEDTKPLVMYAYDVTAEDTFDCRVEYQISEQELANGMINMKKNTSSILQDTDIVFIEIHQHVGGVNLTVDHYDVNGSYVGVFCEASPQYGNGTTVGNEDGYVVAIPSCQFPADSPYQVKKGDSLVIRSYYSSRHIKGGYNYHEGVMGIVFYWGVRTGPTTCEERFKTLCGDPLPSSTQECYECFEKYELLLMDADCGYGNGWQQIIFMCKTDNGVKSRYPIHSENDWLLINKTNSLTKEREQKEERNNKDIHKLMEGGLFGRYTDPSAQCDRD